MCLNETTSFVMMGHTQTCPLTNCSNKNSSEGSALHSVVYSSNNIWMNSIASCGELNPQDSCSRSRTFTSSKYSLEDNHNITTT